MHLLFRLLVAVQTETLLHIVVGVELAILNLAPGTRKMKLVTFPKVVLPLHEICNFCPFGGTSKAHVNPSFHSGDVLRLTT